MNFDPNETKFASDYHHLIWQHGLQIVPLEISLADIEDKETRIACIQIYDCTMEILADMCNQPEAYTTNPSNYTVTYLAWLLEGKQVAPFKRDAEAFAHYLPKVTQFGFIYDDDINEWTNHRYPLFCDYFTRFVALYKKRKKNMGDYTQRLDFRLFAKRVIHTFDDLLRPMPDTERIYFAALREYVLANGMKEKKEGPHFFRYIYKEKVSLELRSLPTRISVPFGEFEQFLALAEKEADADALIDYLLNNITICDGCAANIASRQREKEKKKCGYYWVAIRDAKRLSCVASRITTSQYSRPRALSDGDVEMLKRMIAIRIAQLDH